MEVTWSVWPHISEHGYGWRAEAPDGHSYKVKDGHSTSGHAAFRFVGVLRAKHAARTIAADIRRWDSYEDRLAQEVKGSVRV